MVLGVSFLASLERSAFSLVSQVFRYLLLLKLKNKNAKILWNFLSVYIAEFWKSNRRFYQPSFQNQGKKEENIRLFLFQRMWTKILSNNAPLWSTFVMSHFVIIVALCNIWNTLQKNLSHFVIPGTLCHNLQQLPHFVTTCFSHFGIKLSWIF